MMNFFPSKDNNQIYNELNNKIYTTNNEIFEELLNKLQSTLNDVNNNKSKDIIIKQISNIMKIINKFINDSQNKMNLIHNDINNMANEFKDFKNNISNNDNITIKKTKIYKHGIYIGEFKNQIKDGKGTFFLKMVLDMREIGKTKEKEYFIIKMVINMKVILKMIRKKEKEYFLIMKVINTKVIG